MNIELSDEHKKYNDLHKYCPKCRTTNYSQTYVGYIFSDLDSYKDLNDVHCKCGWEGTVHNLVSGE